MQPLVSIVMPAYNCESYIRQAIDSILEQTHANLELLICDDKSTDSTLSVIESYTDDRLKVFKNTKNQGYPITCNRLFEEACGDYITFQDADDYSDTNRIEIMVGEFENDPDLGMLGSAIVKIDDDGNELDKWIPEYTQYEDLKTNVTSRHLFAAATAMVTRKVYDDIGGYHDYFLNRISFQDYYWAGIIILNYKSRLLENPLYYRRLNPNSISSSQTFHNKYVLLSSVKQLLKQYEETGTNYLLQDKIPAFKSLMAEKSTSVHLEKENYRQAVLSSLNAIRHSPFQVQFYRLCFYSLKRLITKKLMNR
ncbi:MAG: glycosyltransferase family 2 protein [Bacteroidetes bacterium]|nr:glycosyltransferase family 2 protein [Bacteroidota bacterium]